MSIKYWHELRLKMKDREKIRNKLLNYLSDKKCKDCGIDDIRLLTFDHLDPSQKVETVSYLVTKAYSWNIIEKEIAKTDIVCHNCHHIREEIRLNSRRHKFWLKQQENK